MDDLLLLSLEDLQRQHRPAEISEGRGRLGSDIQEPGGEPPEEPEAQVLIGS